MDARANSRQPTVGVTVRELAKEFGTSEKTVRRDLETLQGVGFPLEETIEAYGRKRWRIIQGPKSSPQVSFDLDEAAALYLGRRFLEPLAGTMFWHGAQRAFTKVRSFLGDNALRHLEKMAAAWPQTTFGRFEVSSAAKVPSRPKAAQRHPAFPSQRASRSIESWGIRCNLNPGAVYVTDRCLTDASCALPSAVVAVQGEDPAQTGVTTQPAFRVRSDFAAKLNSDKGWAGGLNENATIFADQPFCIRFEVERSSEATGSVEFRLQYRRNKGDWTHVEVHRFPKPDSRTPPVSMVNCHPNAYKNGAATIDLLKGSPAPFQAGAGVNRADRTPTWEGAGAHGEFEWPLVVLRFADGAVTNEHGDAFEFRMVEAGSGVVESSRNPVLSLAIPRGHVGGTFVETPGRIGPWQAKNGDLYFIMEPAETSNLFMMMKSSDNGATWREVDGANRPKTKDLESVDARQVGDTIHILHQVTKSCRYHTFHTSDHPTQPDSWIVRDELAATAKSVAQAATLAVA